jgi:hypothetical protein
MGALPFQNSNSDEYISLASFFAATGLYSLFKGEKW